MYTDTDSCRQAPQCQGKVAAGHYPAVSLSSTLSSKASLTVSFVGCLPTVPLYAGDVNKTKKSFEYYKIVFHNSLR